MDERDMIGAVKGMTETVRAHAPVAVQGTIAAAFAAALVDLAAAKGVPPDRLLTGTGLSGRDLADRDARVPLAVWVELMRAAKALTGDPALALRFGAAFDLGELSVLGLIGRSVVDGAEGFAMLNRFSRLVADVPCSEEQRFVLVPEGSLTWLVDTRLDPNAAPEISEVGFTQIVTMAKLLQPQTRSFDAAQFTHPAPPHAAAYEEILGVPVTFSSPRNALLMASGWEDRGISAQPRYALEILEPHAEGLLRKLDLNGSTSSRAEEALAAMLGDTKPCLRSLARALGLSEQTLYRRLKAEGTSFDRLLSAQRKRLASFLLEQEGRSVKETAYRLGFSDPAAFSRAFKRWTGKSPAELRPASKRR